MNSTRIIQNYWPLACLKNELALNNLQIGSELGVLNSPCFAIVEEDGSCKVAYHTPILQCFDLLHSEALKLPANRTWPRLFAAHAMLLAMSDRLFGPVTSVQSLPTLTPENGQLFTQFTAAEQWPMDNKTLRLFTVTLCCEFIFGIKIVTLNDDDAKLHFLRSLLPMLPIREEGFPERDSFLSFFTKLRSEIQGDSYALDLAFIDLRGQLEAFLYDSRGGSLQGGRIIEVVLKDKPRVVSALKRINEWFTSRSQPISQDAEDDDAGFVSQISSPAELDKPALDLDDEASASLMESWFGQNSERREISKHIGPYMILKKLGVGGMGSVYLGQAIDGQQVAVKLMNAHLKDSVSDMMRFGREVEIALSLKHPHIVEALDHGVSEGQAYLTLEHMAGGSLEDRITGGKTLEEDKLWAVVLQIASALDYAWNLPKQYMHRDIKADNILFDSHDRAKLADFGLAAGVAPDATRFTNPGMTVGTPLYMSPEQVLDSSNVDTRADLWSLGVLAFRCLTGAYPFSTGETVGLYVEICTAEPADCEERLSPLNESSRSLILRLLNKDPNDRFQTARDLIDAMNEQMPQVETSTDLSESNPRQKKESTGILPGAELKGYTIERELGR
ncbi:MAG: serine/threonine-protein kinase, partial [Planctomycetota bacterium]|nr:serine/threonine-protein kinase [Planctomycetota bacterium]